MSGLQGYSKFGNRRSESRDRHIFASKREMLRYEELLILQAAGEIEGLTLQARYPLVVNKVKVGTYVADFVYREGPSRGSGERPVIEDVKGIRTPVYQLKAKLVKALYDVDILET